MVVLLLRPEALTEAGFQMSFAATTALIAAFEALRGRTWWRETQSERWRYLRPLIGVTVTSFVAGLATAPISAFHFNTMSQYGLLANVLAVPAMGLVVMPAAVLAGLLAPFGLAAPALWAMDLGIEYILRVAEFVAGLEGAVRPVHAGPMASLVLITLGGLVLVLWLGRGRALGLVPILAGLLLWSQAGRPDILISEDGRLFGILGPEGRVLNTPRGNGFAAENWLQNDGDRADQPAAFARGEAEMTRSRGRAESYVAGLGAFRYLGSPAPDTETRDACHDSALLLAPRWRDPPGGRCLFIGADRLAHDGALAIRLAGRHLELQGAKALNRTRPWTADPDRRRIRADDLPAEVASTD
jgi:competence protein ComEC